MTLKKKVIKKAPKVEETVKEEAVKEELVQEEVSKPKKAAGKPKKTVKKEEAVVTPEVTPEPPTEEKPKRKHIKKGGKKEEKPVTAVATVDKKPEEPSVDRVEVEYPDEFITKRGNTYTKLTGLSFEDMKKKVNLAPNFPIRLMVKEPNRAHISEFVVSAVLSRVHLIDVSSKDGDFESSFYATQEDFERGEFLEDVKGNGKIVAMPFAFYEISKAKK